MASHQQLLYHVVFSTKERRPLLQNDDFRANVWRYMAGVASRLQGHALRVGGYFDNAHLLLRIPAKIAVADFVRQLKASTSEHINEEKYPLIKFNWQDGCGAFSVSRSKVEAVLAYIDCKMEHNHQRTSQDEYLKMLADHEVDYDPEYLWESWMNVPPSGLGLSVGPETGGLHHRQRYFALRANHFTKPKSPLKLAPVTQIGLKFDSDNQPGVSNEGHFVTKCSSFAGTSYVWELPSGSHKLCNHFCSRR
jgi:putative transposase